MAIDVPHGEKDVAVNFTDLVAFLADVGVIE
jgi:hypothetical protein